MLDGRVLEASQVEYKPFGKPPLKTNHACTHRKAAEKVILSSCGGSNHEARKRELGIFFLLARAR